MSRLSVYRGDDKTFNFTFKNSNGAAINITDWTIFFTLKEHEADADDDAKIKKDVTSHTSPTDGLSQLSITDSDTNLDPKKYYYDFQIKKDDGIIRTLVKGDFRVLTGITRRTS